MSKRFTFKRLAVGIAGALALAASASASAADCPVAAPKDLVEPGFLTIGTALTAPPMGFVDAGQPAGFDPELAGRIAEAMCLKPKYVNLAFAGLFPGLIAKKFDVIASQVGITPVRQETFDFVPVFLGGLRLVTQKDSGLRAETEADVCGHTASIMTGSTQMAALERVKKDCPAGKPMELKIFSNQNEALNELTKKSVNFAYVDWPVAAYLIQQRPGVFVEASPILSGKGPGTERNRNGIVIRKGDAAMQTAVTDAFKSVVDRGQYQAILKKWNLAGGDIRSVSQ